MADTKCNSKMLDSTEHHDGNYFVEFIFDIRGI